MKHAEESEIILREETLNPTQNAAHIYGEHYDNYTTYHMLNLAVQSSSSPFVDALASKNYYDEDFGQALKHAIAGESNGSYPRYWHGYLVFLRPLLVLFNVTQIRLLLQVVFFSMMAFVIARLALAKGSSGAMAGVLLMVSFAALGAAQAAETLPIAPSFLLSIFGCICVLRLSSMRLGITEKKFSERFTLFCLFGIMGALTVFFDFLDNPILTLCVPLSLYLFCEKSNLTLKRVLCVLCFSMLGWCLGYGLLWIAKWLLAGVVTGHAVLENALGQAAFRSGVTAAGAETGGAIRAIWENIKSLGFMKYAYALTGFLAVACVALAMMLRMSSSKRIVVRGSTLGTLIGLLAVSALPYLWYATLSNHSIVHASLMAYRTQIGSLFPWLLIIGMVVVCFRGAGRRVKEPEKLMMKTDGKGASRG